MSDGDFRLMIERKVSTILHAAADGQPEAPREAGELVAIFLTDLHRIANALERIASKTQGPAR